MVWLVQTLADPDDRGGPALVPVHVSRRKVLAAGGAGLLGALDGWLDPDELARVEAAIVTPSRVDLATVGHLEALLAHYRSLDHVVGPRRLLVPVHATLDLVDDLGKDAQAPARQALLSLSAQYEQLTGWLWTDGGNQAKAQRAYDQAFDRATEAGNQALAGYVLACKSEQTRYAGHTDTAVELAQAAQRGEWRLTPVVRARAADWEARAQALDGKRDECKRKLDEAAELLTESAGNGRAEEPPWISHFVEAQLAVHRGICLTDLGEASPAIEVFEHALAALPADRIRDRAYYLACSAQAHLGNDDPEQAAAVAQEGAQIAIAIGSSRSLEKLRGLHAELSKAHQDVRAVQELGELLLRSASA